MEGASDDLAKNALQKIIQGKKCRGGETNLGFWERINRCTSRGGVWIEEVKPNRIQKVGIAISDFLDRILN